MCLDYCIWKFGRRHERRRLHRILREQEKRRVRLLGNESVVIEQRIGILLEMGIEELKREVE